ncbi:inositol 1,4,5-trisphosphate receptor-interacting protein-like 1 [Buteo buteo]|uniref:inositol 1,4,5-trisphosphate receptor-interacting protein-like 1 n=1 Tax=Buteo buteo TaxID=30397 RepID=UPI003EBEA08B
MDVIRFFALVLGSIIWNVLQELEQSGFSWGALLFAALEQWQSWAIGGVLLLLFGLCWWLRKRSRQPASSSKETAEEEEEVNSCVAGDVDIILLKRLLDLQKFFLMMDELLHMCQMLSRNTFRPQLQPAVRVRSALEGWSVCEDDAVYHLLVPLKPPRGHAFHLELRNKRERPVRKCRVRVELECTCRRERLVEDMLCFLHHPEEELRRNQAASLLETFCTGPYLDMEKSTRWFQVLVKAAWVVLPQSTQHRLIVLRSRRSCKLRLTNTSNSPQLIEMTFVVQQDGLDTFLSIE